MSQFTSARRWCALILGVLFICLQAQAANTPYYAIVTSPNATVWRDPGFSWKDCSFLKNEPVDQLEYTFLDMRAQTGASKKACDSREAWPESGTQVALITNPDGSLKFEEHDVVYGNELIKKKFYRVWYRKKDKTAVAGWISEDQLGKPNREQEDISIKPDPPVQPKECDCLPTGSKQSNGAPEIRREVEKIKTAIVDVAAESAGRKIDHTQKELSPRKTDAEIDRYMCLYRAGHNDEADFAKHLAKFKKAAKAAEQAFKVPYALTMCLALTESSLKHVTAGEYKGYGQFGSERVSDLKKALERDPYKQMWSDYKSKTNAPNFTDKNIRETDSPEAAIGAMALAWRQSYGTLYPHGKCMDCTSARGDPKTADMANINRKDLYLFVGGYNFTPSQIPAMAKRTTAGLATSYPPPEESRNYMKQMDNCMTQGEELRFRDASSERANARRKRDIRNINALAAKRKGKSKTAQEIAQIKSYQDLIAANASQEYEDKIQQCNRTHPK